jgi:hypothetical protein
MFLHKILRGKRCFFIYKRETSVADPGCLYRIPDPDFYPSRIPDPKTATKERGEKKFDVKPFYVATKFNKIVNYFSFEVQRKKLGQFSKNYRTFYQKNCQKALQNMVLGSGIRDPGSGKNRFRIPDPGVKKAQDPGSRIRNTAGNTIFLHKHTGKTFLCKNTVQMGNFS